MFVRCIFRRAARPVVADPNKFSNLFVATGLDASAWTNWALLAPLQTQHFCFDDNRLFCLGDAIIQDVVASALSEYCVRHEIIAGPNLVAVWAAVFYHPYALRYAAEELGMLDLVAGTNQLTAPLAAPDEEVDSRHILEVLEGVVKEPTRSDTLGTSFHHDRHAFARSPLPMKLSHFIGAVHMDRGAETARAVALRVLRLDTSVNLPRAATELLWDVVRRYHSTNVALSLLATTGVQVKWGCETTPIFDDGLGDDADDMFGGDGGAGQSGYKGNGSGVAAAGAHTASSEGAVQDDRGGDTMMNTRPDPQEVAAMRTPSSMPFLERMMKYDVDEHERAVGSAENVASKLPPVPIPSGWLETPDPVSSQANAPIARTSYIDTFSTALPTGGHYVGHRPYKSTRSAEDPDYYDSQSSRQRGVAFDTHGLSMNEYLDAVAGNSKNIGEDGVPALRMVFTVTARSVGSDKVVAAATAPSYCQARVEVMRKALVGISRDLQSIAEGHHTHHMDDEC